MYKLQNQSVCPAARTVPYALEVHSTQCTFTKSS